MPPPPPPAPPPLPFLGGNKATKADFKPAPDRNALLSQIRKGRHLKNVETNDRSSPLVDGLGRKTASGGNATNVCKSNGPSPLIPPGGLFAQGMPKLRSTTSKGGDGGVRPAPVFSQSNVQNESPFAFDKTPGTLYPNDTGGSRSQPPSPAAKIRQMQGVHRSLTETASCRNFPSDVSVKGPAPAPPPANQKPNFNSDFCAKNKQVSVRRSSSQTSLGPKIRPVRPPPNIRPPPPPKSSSVVNSAPPPPPSKPPNVLRRQSFGISDTTFMMNYDGSRFSSKLSVPPPPPRNNSAPNSLNQVQNSPGSTHVNKMMTAPPPPPNRPAVGNVRAPVVRPPPPPIRAPAPPPPPPPHRFVAHPMPPPQLKSTHLTNSVAPPPPPTRISSATSNAHSSDFAPSFETRFMHKFSNMRNFPAPAKFTNIRKVYSSRMLREKSVRRQPPPPPPTVNGSTNAFRGGPPSHQPVLHIQLDSRIFANNTAHC